MSELAVSIVRYVLFLSLQLLGLLYVWILLFRDINPSHKHLLRFLQEQGVHFAVKLCFCEGNFHENKGRADTGLWSWSETVCGITHFVG